MSGFCPICGSTAKPSGRSWSVHRDLSVAWARCGDCRGWYVEEWSFRPFSYLASWARVLIDEAWCENLGLPWSTRLAWRKCRTCGCARPFVVTTYDDYDAFGYATGRTHWRETCAFCKEENL